MTAPASPPRGPKWIAGYQEGYAHAMGLVWVACAHRRKRDCVLWQQGFDAGVVAGASEREEREWAQGVAHA